MLRKEVEKLKAELKGSEEGGYTERAHIRICIHTPIYTHTQSARMLCVPSIEEVRGGAAGPEGAAGGSNPGVRLTDEGTPQAAGDSLPISLPLSHLSPSCRSVFPTPGSAGAVVFYFNWCSSLHLFHKYLSLLLPPSSVDSPGGRRRQKGSVVQHRFLVYRSEPSNTTHPYCMCITQGVLWRPHPSPPLLPHLAYSVRVACNMYMCMRNWGL